MQLTMLASFLLGSLACGTSSSPAQVVADAGADEVTADAESGPSEPHLVLLFTSDEHSHVFSFSPELDDYPTEAKPGTGTLVGGVARRATVLKRERDAAKAAGKSTLTVSAGDNQMGTLVEVGFATDSIDYGTMASLGYDVTTLGNHEFDFGPGALAKAISAAKAHGGLPAIVASNLHLSDTDPADDALAALFSADAAADTPVHPYRVITADNGLKVGFFGYVGVNAEHVAPNKTPVTFSAAGGVDEGKADAILPKLFGDLQPVVDKLRMVEKVDLVIGLSHAGVNDSKMPETGEDYRVAANVPGIDVIVSGHAHNDDPKPIVVHNATSGKDVLVLNASSYGRHVGRVDLTVPLSGAISFDASTQALLPVDDKTAPDPKQVTANDAVLAALEMGAQRPYLDGLFARGLGQPVTFSKPGSLYFAEVGHTTFDIVDTHALLFLTADAQLAAIDQIAPTDMALQSAGVIRGGLMKGKTGIISAADAFGVVPLGVSTDGTPGYPLIRAYVRLLFIRAIFEAASSLSQTNSDYDLAPAGVTVEYDCTRAPLTELGADLFDPTKGRVMKIWLDSDHSDGFEQFDKLIYDRAAMDPNPVGPAFSVATSSYIAAFASDVGASIENAQGMTTTIKDSLAHRADASEIKEVESFVAYLHAATPEKMSLYDKSSASKTKRFAAFAACP
jgi:5'-nucleotidase / UDP-sugar diphosphatase